MSDPLDEALRKFFEGPSIDPTKEAQSSLATLHYGLYEQYIEAGFDEDQAFELVLTVVRGLLGALR